MRKLLFTMLFVVVCSLAFSQIKVAGTVKDAGNKSPVIGATIIVQGTTTGTTTGEDGRFVLTVPNASAVLTVEFMGYKPQEVTVGDRTNLDILLSEEQIAMDEVVVTALNVPKQKAALGYSVQEVKGEDMAKSRDANPFTSLVGKVAGMRIGIPSDLMKSPEIQIRGVTPMIVIDGVPVQSDTWNVSPDDIESFSVLKGPTAAALYGSQGKNGVIQITTKRAAQGGKAYTVEINSSTQFQSGFIAIPKVQNEYGSGSNFQYDFGDGLKGNINGINNSDSDVWGPRLEGQLIKQWNSPMDANGIRTPIPWLPRGVDNLQAYMQTGLLTSNNIAVSSGNKSDYFRISISDTYQKGLFPNTKLNSSNVNIAGGTTLSKKVRVEGNLNYNRTNSPNYPDVEYNPRSPLYLLTVWSGANNDVRDLKNYWVPGMEGLQQINYDYAQYNNPWFQAYENTRGHYKDDVHGQVNLSWRITPDLDVRLRSNLSTYSLNKNEKYPVSGSVYDEAYKWVGGYEESNEKFFEWDNDILINYAKQLSRSFGIKASLGASYRNQQQNESWAGTLGGLIVPGIYTLQNSVESRPGTSSSWKKQVGSVYGYVDLDYKNYLFLGLTGRMDKSSTLPLNNNTYFYPSVSLSAVISEMVDISKVFSFLKIRGSYARVGGDMEVYGLTNTYNQGNRWNGMTPLYYSSTALDPNIEPEFSSSYEFGADMRFFKNRLGIDATYFYAEDGPQIFELDTPPSSGFDKRKLNGLTYKRKGYEVAVTAAAIRNKTFNWDITANISSSHRFLKEVYGDVSNLGYVKLGERIDQIWVEDFMRSASGEVIYKDGMPQRDPIKKYWGNSDPDFIYGLSNRFSYKNFTLVVSVDGAVGGLIANDTWENLWKSGRHEKSANEWRYKDWEAYKKDPNGYGTTYKGSLIPDGVVVTDGELKRDADGNVISDSRTYAKNTTPVLYYDWAGSSRGYYRTESQRMQDRTYLKLREVTLTYDLPQRLLKKTGFISKASVSFIGRNLLYFAKADYIDLDQFLTGTTALQTPSPRSYGFNVNIVF